MTGAGPANRWNSGSYERNTRFVSTLGMGVVELLAPVPGERILDLGCGDGALSVELVKAGADVVGVDQSDDFVAAARERGIDARVGDATRLDFDAEFDAVFTNAVLHWIPDASAVAQGVRRALKPGGRFVGEFGGFGNVAAIATALRSAAHRYGVDAVLATPWYYPRPEEYTAVLQDAGLAVDTMELFARPTPLPTGIEGWLSVMRASYFDTFGDRRDEAVASVVAALEPSLRAADGTWYADYVRLRFKATASP